MMMMVVTGSSESPGPQTQLPVGYCFIQELVQLFCDTIKLKSQNIVKQRKIVCPTKLVSIFGIFVQYFESPCKLLER